MYDVSHFQTCQQHFTKARACVYFILQVNVFSDLGRDFKDDVAMSLHTKPPESLMSSSGGKEWKTLAVS